jgi:hypothetical protein
VNVAAVTDAGIDVECPLVSLTVMVALPPPTGVTVNVSAVSSRRRALVELVDPTVTTLVFEDVAVNAPLYPDSLTVNVCGFDDENENDGTDSEIIPEEPPDPLSGKVCTDVHPTTNRNAERHDDKTKDRGLIKRRPFH